MAPETRAEGEVFSSSKNTDEMSDELTLRKIRKIPVYSSWCTCEVIFFNLTIINQYFVPIHGFRRLIIHVSSRIYVTSIVFN